MLCIDHINNDGAEHNKIHKDNLYSWLITHGFPSGFQVLCANHNTKKENVRRREKINYINK